MLPCQSRWPSWGPIAPPHASLTHQRPSLLLANSHLARDDSRRRRGGSLKVYEGLGCRSSERFSCCQFLKQRLRLFQIARVETLGEPAVDRSKKLAGLIPLTLITPEPRDAPSSG